MSKKGNYWLVFFDASSGCVLGLKVSGHVPQKDVKCYSTLCKQTLTKVERTVVVIEQHIRVFYVLSFSILGFTKVFSKAVEIRGIQIKSLSFPKCLRCWNNPSKIWQWRGGQSRYNKITKKRWKIGLKGGGGASVASLRWPRIVRFWAKKIFSLHFLGFRDSYIDHRLLQLFKNSCQVFHGISCITKLNSF